LVAGIAFMYEECCASAGLGNQSLLLLKIITEMLRWCGVQSTAALSNGSGRKGTSLFNNSLSGC